MTFLLDTDVWRWWTSGNTDRIWSELRRDIESAHADVFVSVADLWENAIKAALKRLEFPANAGTYALRRLKRQRFTLLPIDAPHIDAAAALPHIHRDPFDRMIITQAKVEASAIVTADLAFVPYHVPTIWV